MNIIITPSSIRLRDRKKMYIYKCPKCKLRLWYQVHRDLIVKILLPWLPLKKYMCEGCLSNYYIYVRKYKN